MIKITLLLFLVVLILFAVAIMIGKMINAQKYKIRSETGIQTADYIAIGGIRQYVQIRGQDVSNPIIVMLHGGPGSNMAYYSYVWQANLEKEYTIVHWDQRGCGNTYYYNQMAEKPTVDLLLSDLDELVEYIRLTYHKEKVILMGHSWGTFLGGIYSGEHPEKISAYTAIGQMVDFRKSEQVSAQEAIRLANMAGKVRHAREINETLELIMTFRELDKSKAMALIKFRQRKERYLPSQYGSKMGILRLLSPYMTFHDFKWMMSFDKLIESNSSLYEVLFSDGKLSMYNYNMKFEVPVIIIGGDWDWTTPYHMASDYFQDITAPKKEFITIENTGHIPFVDKPEEFSKALSNTLSNALS